MFNGVPVVPMRRVFGGAVLFLRVSTSREDTRCALTLLPRIALLAHTKGSETFLNQSVTEVEQQILRKQGLEGPDFEFSLSRGYPAREL